MLCRFWGEFLRPFCPIVSGSVGDHGIAVMLAREAFGLRGDIQSDAASVLSVTQAALLKNWRSLEEGQDAAILGHVDSDVQHFLMETDIGGERILEELEDDPLPRICQFGAAAGIGHIEKAIDIYSRRGAKNA